MSKGVVFAKYLEDGTKVIVEYNGGDLVQLGMKKGKVSRSMGLSLKEAETAAELLKAATGVKR